MSRTILAALIAVLLVPAAASAAVQPAANEDLVTWSPKKPTLKASARKVRIKFSYGTCGLKRPNSISRIVVKRRAKSVIITVLMSKIPKGGPYAVCPDIATVFHKTVKLRGRLGHRSVKDGATSPAQVRIKRP